jgi:hypothetical protein
VDFERALNKIGAQCLPYPEKGSTIGDAVTLFEKEITALPDAIAQANKNFLVYCLVGVLKMLQGHAKCRHIDGLGIIMTSCDASILDEVPDDIVAFCPHREEVVVFVWFVVCYQSFPSRIGGEAFIPILRYS